MASHDTERRTRRAISQDNSASIQKLNQELRKLKEGAEREGLNKDGPKPSETNTRKPKT